MAAEPDFRTLTGNAMNTSLNRRQFQLGLCASTLALPMLARGQAKLRLAGGYPLDSFHTVNLLAFAGDVKEATSGRMDIDVRPNGELLKAADMVPGAADGRVEGGEVFMATLAKEHPVMGIDSFPFIVSSYADARLLWDASRGAVADALARRGLALLFAVPWPPLNLYANRPIARPEDFRGLRMRHYSPATQRIAEFLGATPVTTSMQMAAIEKAIAAREFDLMLTSSLAGVITKAWTSMTHYYQVSSSIPKNVIFMRKDVLDKASAGDRKAFMEAAQRAELRGWQASGKINAEMEAQLVKNRIAVAGMEPVVRRFLDRAGERLTLEWMATAQPAELQVLSGYMAQRVARR